MPSLKERLNEANGPANEQLYELRSRRAEQAEAGNAKIIADLGRVASESGVVQPHDSIKVHTGEHPVVKIPPAELGR